MTIDKNELATPQLSGLLDFWLGKCSAGNPPVSSAIAPADLRPWKENIAVFEVIGDNDFVYSYYGAALASAFGESRLGATLDALPSEQRAILGAEYGSVTREKLPVARTYTADFFGTARTWERLVLPLSSDGVAIDKLLVAAYEVATPVPAVPPESQDASGSVPTESRPSEPPSHSFNADFNADVAEHENGARA